MRHKRNPKKQPAKRGVASVTTPTTTKLSIQDADPEDAGPPSSTSPSRASTPSTNASKTSFVRPSLALTKLQQDNQDQAHEEEVEEYSPHDPYFTPASQRQQEYIYDIEPADPKVIEEWEKDLRRRLEQAYPRMCYYFLCDKSLFVLVTLLTLRRIAKADMLSGRPVGSGRRDRQFVDDIAQCMSDAEMRIDKDEEWMTWWRETLLTVQGGLQRGWIHADSPNIVYAKQVMQLYRRIARIARRVAEAERAIDAAEAAAAAAAAGA